MNRNPRPHIPRLYIPWLPPKDIMMLPHLPEITRRSLAITYMLVLLSACGGQDTTRTGFIGNYDGMKPTKAHTADLIFVDPGYEPGQYRAAFLDTVEWTPAPDSPTRSPEVIAELTADFRKSLTEKLARSFVIVPKPAPGSVAPAGVLRIRGAITNTRKANWWLNLPVQVLGVGLSVVGLPGLPPPNPGGGRARRWRRWMPRAANGWLPLPPTTTACPGTFLATIRSSATPVAPSTSRRACCTSSCAPLQPTRRRCPPKVRSSGLDPAAGQAAWTAATKLSIACSISSA